MKKYKTLLIVLLVFLCCLSLYSAYGIINNIYNILYIANEGWYPDQLQVMLSPIVIILVFNICIEGFSAFGIVVLVKILKDKQLFADDKHPATQNNDETPTNQE